VVVGAIVGSGAASGSEEVDYGGGWEVKNSAEESRAIDRR